MRPLRLVPSPRGEEGVEREWGKRQVEPRRRRDSE